MVQTTVPHVYKAIHAVLKALSIEGIAKDQWNDQQKFRFRGIDAMLNALSGHLAANDLLILPRVVERTLSERETKSGGALFSVTVKIEYDFISALDGSKATAVLYGEAMDSGDKATNKAMSAAYKYMAIQSFAIPTEAIQDNDADASAPPEVKGRATEKREALQRPEGQRPPVDERPPEQRAPQGKSTHPLLLQLDAALKKYGDKRDHFAAQLAAKFNVDSIEKIPAAILPQALIAVQKHQAEARAKAAEKKAAGKKPAGGKKADLPPPDGNPPPDQQVDDSPDGDDGIPV
jgi:hypothetical protein